MLPALRLLVLVVASVAPSLVGCSTPAPTNPEGCMELGSATARDECFLLLLPSIFKTDPARGIELTLSSVSDPATRDFVWLTVTRDVDPNSDKYCNRITDTLLKDRCKVLVSRPHLHRNLIDGKGPPMGAHGQPGVGGPPQMGGPRPPPGPSGPASPSPVSPAQP